MRKPADRQATGPLFFPREILRAVRPPGTDCSAFRIPCSKGNLNMGIVLARVQGIRRRELLMTHRTCPPACLPRGGTPRPYPRRVNTKGGTTRPRGRTKACSAAAASGQPPPAAEAKGHRPRALEPLAPMSEPPAHGAPRGRLPLTGSWAPPYPASASARRCRRRLPQAPLSPRKPHFRFRTLLILPPDWLLLPSIRRAGPIAVLKH